MKYRPLSSLFGSLAPVRASHTILPMLLGLAVASALAQTTSYEEFQKKIKAPNAVSAYGSDLFGDHVNLYNGSLEFIQTDVSIPGNNGLPVAMGRKLIAGQGTRSGRQFGRWEADIPHLYGVFSKSDGWTSGGPIPGARCSDFGAPASAAGTQNLSAWSAWEFWHGSFLHMPGGGEQRLLLRDAANTHVPNGSTATYPVVTTQFWSFSCLTSLASDTTAGKTQGQGFLGVAPDGTQYRFDWMTDFTEAALTKGDPNEVMLAPQGTTSPHSNGTPQHGTGNTLSATTAQLERKEVWILPTLVTDRFGNWVRYTYDPAMPRRLTKIDSSDGRVLSFGYVSADDMIRTVSDGTRTWNYNYSSGDLTSITLPDNSSWQFSNTYGLTNKLINSGPRGCDEPDAPTVSAPANGSMTHPSGAIGTFTLTPTVHGRSDVPYNCFANMAGLVIPNPIYFSSLALTSKSISGPGLPAMNWSYDYGTPNASWSTCTTCATTKTVSVTDPDNQTTHHTFGNRFDKTEGQLFEVDVAGLRTTATRYRALGAGPYMDWVGTDGEITGDSGTSSRLMPVEEKVTTQQGTTFTWTVNTFDTSFGRPLQVTRSSSLGMSRTETTAYADNLNKWVLAQVASVTHAGSGKVMVQNQYDATSAQLLSVTRFGLLEATMSYNADGTLATRKDGLNQSTGFSNYKRGIPQTISFANGTSESVVVNNIGGIDTLTDENGYTTTLAYDAIGRLKQVTPPTADTVAWNPTVITFAPVQSAEFDLPAGHWRQDVTTGNARTSTYYDALWRAVYTQTSDLGAPSTTARIVRRVFDHAGRPTFESYPKRSYAELGDGKTSHFDALGRLTQSSVDSELGTLSTTFSYNYGFTKTATDARQHSTVFSYQAYDTPSEDAITNIAAPEGVNVVIARDVFGKSTSITRSGAGKSATRSYVYDQYERLCKTIEPETGATIQSYDAANNVQWRSSGNQLLSTSNCDTASVTAAKKTTFGYDLRNRLLSTTYGDGSPSITRTYTPDSLPLKVTSNGTVWDYTYNKHRLLERESLTYGGASYTIDRTYNANGSALTLKYPGNGLTVSYLPNALGEPSQVGSYATAISYHPNGAIAGFTYGNGIKHTLLQNRRGLPQQSSDTGVLSDNYTYDENANVAGITDLLAGTTNRSMAYDDLDRLKSVSAPNLWGNASYSYDTLDNLTGTTITAGAKARSTVHTFDAVSNRLTSVSGPAAYNFSYGYDSQGNITQRGSQAYVFDQGNRMSSATGKATYVYDGLGRRVSVVGTDSVNRVQVYSQAGQLLWSGASGTVGTKYIFLHNHVIAEVAQ